MKSRQWRQGIALKWSQDMLLTWACWNWNRSFECSAFCSFDVFCSCKHSIVSAVFPLWMKLSKCHCTLLIKNGHISKTKINTQKMFKSLGSISDVFLFRQIWWKMSDPFFFLLGYNSNTFIIVYWLNLLAWAAQILFQGMKCIIIIQEVSSSCVHHWLTTLNNTVDSCIAA